MYNTKYLRKQVSRYAVNASISLLFYAYDRIENRGKITLTRAWDDLNDGWRLAIKSLIYFIHAESKTPSYRYALMIEANCLHSTSKRTSAVLEKNDVLESVCRALYKSEFIKDWVITVSVKVVNSRHVE